MMKFVLCDVLKCFDFEVTFVMIFYYIVTTGLVVLEI